MAVFMELTNPIHGGEGWELGEVLWSPVASSWNNIMKQPKEGDIVIHSVKDKKRNINHRLWGISTVDKSYKVLSTSPPIPGFWNGYEYYYQIPLKHYKEFNEKVFLQEFINQNEAILREMIPQRSFYTESGIKMQPAQKYLAQLSNELFQLITPYLGIAFYEDKTNKIVSENIVREGDVEEQITIGKYGKPERVKTVVNRIVRDTTLVKNLKQIYENKCQICGKKLQLYDNIFYSEGHHLKKLGGIHQGPDTEDNIIILCPNHHVEFDYGIIAIDVHTKRIIHKNKNDVFYNQKLAYERKNLNDDYLKYHFDVIFSP